MAQIDRGFEYDDSGDAANWGGTNETDDWRNDDSKKGAPGVVDVMKRVFSKYAEPRGAQGWQDLKGTGNKDAAAFVGKTIAEKAKTAGIEKVAFDRSGFKYHGRVKALADAAREAGLQF